MKLTPPFLLIFILLTLSCKDEIELHDVWIKKNSIETLNSFRPIGFTLENALYVGIGYGTKPENDWWQFDASKDQWLRKKDFPGTSRMNGIYTSDGSKGYFGLGFSYEPQPSGSAFSDIWEYDSSIDAWTFLTTAPFTSSIMKNCAWIVDRRLYISSDKTLWCFNLDNKTWQRKNDLPFVPSMQPLGNRTQKVIVSGNEVLMFWAHIIDPHLYGYVTELWKYDAEQDSWLLLINSLVKDSEATVNFFATEDIIYLLVENSQSWETLQVPGVKQEFKTIRYPEDNKTNEGITFMLNKAFFFYEQSGGFWQYIP